MLEAAAVGAGVARGAPRTGRPSAGLDRLRSRVGGRVLVPGDPGYDEERAAWNLHIDSRPAVIVAAETTSDVADTVRFAGEHGLPVAVQATGHGQAHESDGAVLVSTRSMDGVVVDTRRQVARLEAGALWRTVIDRAVPHGLAPPSGSISHLGAVGYLSGGGLPVLGRQFGFGVDHVRAIEIVTADGRVRSAAPGRSDDLFWAARGGLGNFGIVTRAAVQLLSQPRFYGGNLGYAGADARRVTTAWLAWVREQPREMSTSVLWIRYPDDPALPEVVRGRFLVHLRIAYAGNAAQGERLVRPLRALGPQIDGVTERPYTDIDEVHQDPVLPLPALEHSRLMGDLDERFVDQLMAVAGPEAAEPLAIIEVRRLGGALAEPPERPSAIGHRASRYTLLLAGVAPPGQAERMLQVLSSAADATASWATGAVFPNFLGGSGHGDPARVPTAYEPDDYRRLSRIKAEYDPGNMFRLNHNIPPDPGRMA